MDRIAHMQAFVAVAEHESFTAAARRLGVSPPVVTRAIAALEDRLGARLFERTTRKVRATEVGARYLSDCKRLLTELDDAEKAVSGVYGLPRGQLSVTAPFMFGRMFMAPLLADFLARHPAVTALTHSCSFAHAFCSFAPRLPFIRTEVEAGGLFRVFIRTEVEAGRMLKIGT